MVLQGIELMVAALLLQKLLVIALLQNFALTEHDNIICVLDGGKSVGYNQHSADIARLFQRILNENLGLRINIGCGFIQNHNRRLMDDGTGKA